ncbi:hypothetical protein A2U01_0004060 [Trifolium medium]|uniref:Uncharacterized protein n=1 Tax=Trifolium medium TaxID=97028 RepID=A0A392M6Z5_9FABA|nr:hypothetical protein [Trifolium medium]
MVATMVKGESSFGVPPTYSSLLNSRISLLVLLEDEDPALVSTDNISSTLLFIVPFDGLLDNDNPPMMEAICQLDVLAVFMLLLSKSSSSEDEPVSLLKNPHAIDATNWRFPLSASFSLLFTKSIILFGDFRRGDPLV